ncbi:MAG: alpha/beta fold hydrolase, partial [Saprospiraceae bacterium]
LFAINEHLQMGATDTMYSVSSMAVDMSIPDYFLAPTVGATLILAGDATKKDGFLLKEELEDFRPTVMQATPTTWKMLLLSGWKGDENLTAVAGGEGFPKDTARQLMESCKAVYNGYGPTEATIYTTYKKITEQHLTEEAVGEFVAIGAPINNFTTLILDKQMRPVPIGMAGELHIGGVGLSHEYLQRPALTADKFVDSPFGKLYKTGDRVRYLLNGDIDFLGRIDSQVKIRGYRMELGEIEEVMQQHEAVSQAAVKVVKDAKGNPQLVGYFILQDTDRKYLRDTSYLKDFLRSKLPGFMVPQFFVEMQEFPLTTSLKVDRKKLPAPVIESQQEYSEPQTKNEQLIAGLFTELLDIQQVGVNDNFFELGGHSLIAVELMAKIQQQTGEKLPLTTLFQYSTVQQLAAILPNESKAVSNKNKSRFTSLIPIRPTGTKLPIYLVHGGGLHVLFYQTLVQHLGDDQPVYALQARGLNGDEEPLDRIEDMAAHYLSEIQELNPEGPYHFAGYSLGGLIAWEMAKQVREQGKQVGLLALFDAPNDEIIGNILRSLM